MNSHEDLISPLEPERDGLEVAGVLLHPDQDKSAEEDEISIPENQAVVANSLQRLDARVEEYGSISAYETKPRRNGWQKAGIPPENQMEIERTDIDIEESNIGALYSPIVGQAIEQGITLDYARLKTLNSKPGQYGLKLELAFSDPGEEEEQVKATQNLGYDLKNDIVNSSWSFTGNPEYIEQIEGIISSEAPNTDKNYPEPV